MEGAKSLIKSTQKRAQTFLFNDSPPIETSSQINRNLITCNMHEFIWLRLINFISTFTFATFHSAAA